MSLNVIILIEEDDSSTNNLVLHLKLPHRNHLRADHRPLEGRE